MYYGIYADKYIPWLAKSMDYTGKDFTTLEIKLNPLAQWSDGTPVTADDVVYTFEGQMKNEKLNLPRPVRPVRRHGDRQGQGNRRGQIKIPAPRFKFEVLTLKFDTGIPIVPKAWEEKQADVNAAAGGTEIPHSGPLWTSLPGTPTRRSSTCARAGGRSRPG